MKTSIPIIILTIIFSVSSCSTKDKKTEIEITHPDRHYYPLFHGQELDILYEVKNVGENLLFVEDLVTSCGCVIVDQKSFKVLPPGGVGTLKLRYDSRKNIGYVKHYITIYANFEKGDFRELSFDVNVVPNALYTKDYEEIYEEQVKGGLIKGLVDGDDTPRYYVD